MYCATPVSRRRFTLTALCATLLGPAQMGLANTDRDKDDDRTGYKPFFTVSQFYKLSKKEVRKIRGARRGRDIVIEGFSISMTDYVFEMSANNWAATRRLVRDMAKIKDAKARKARLQSEIKKIKDLIANLEASIRRLSESGGSPLAILQERGRLSHSRDFLGGLETWLEFPHEGTREK